MWYVGRFDGISSSRNFETSDTDPAEEKKAPTLPAQKEKPHFSAETLPQIFASKKWVGQTNEMATLWKQVPDSLKEKFDFSSAYSNAWQRTLKQDHPKKDVFKKPPPL